MHKNIEHKQVQAGALWLEVEVGNAFMLKYTGITLGSFLLAPVPILHVGLPEGY